MNKEILDKIKKDIIIYGLMLDAKDKVIIQSVLNIIERYYYTEILESGDTNE